MKTFSISFTDNDAEMLQARLAQLNRTAPEPITRSELVREALRAHLAGRSAHPTQQEARPRGR